MSCFNYITFSFEVPHLEPGSIISSIPLIQGSLWDLDNIAFSLRKFTCFTNYNHSIITAVIVVSFLFFPCVLRYPLHSFIQGTVTPFKTHHPVLLFAHFSLYFTLPRWHINAGIFFPTVASTTLTILFGRVFSICRLWNYGKFLCEIS